MKCEHITSNKLLNQHRPALCSEPQWIPTNEEEMCPQTIQTQTPCFPNTSNPDPRTEMCTPLLHRMGNLQIMVQFATDLVTLLAAILARIMGLPPICGARLEIIIKVAPTSSTRARTADQINIQPILHCSTMIFETIPLWAVPKTIGVPEKPEHCAHTHRTEN